MKRSFHSIQLNGNFMERNFPVLLICNHMSWWDGIWAFYFNQKILNRKFYFMMLEEQLRKNWYFKYTGGFSIAPKSKSVIESINYSVELLEHPGNVVLMFPQGEIQSMHRDNFNFEKGIGRILEKASKQIQIVMLANFVDYLSAVKPNLHIFYKEFSGEHSCQNIEKAYNGFYNDCLQIQQNMKS